MADTERERKSVMPTILLVSGIADGIIGLIMLVLGIEDPRRQRFRRQG